MQASKTTVYRGLAGIFAGGLIGAAASATIALPAAGAAPDTTTDSTCSASAVAATVSSVSQSVGNYLASNTEADEALSAIAKQPADAAEDAYEAYFDANPAVATELRELQQPVRDLNAQCDIKVMPSQAIEALESI
jgi:hemophore-related protein